MQRDFFLGSEWLYYKIYTGPKTSDIILVEKLQPVISELINQNVIQKWFFIRFKDPDEHLRVRFLVENTKNLPIVINKLYPILNQLMKENIIWKVQTDSYQREIERYGNKTILASEFLFCKDSDMIIKYLEMQKSFTDKNTPLLFSFLAIESFLNSFSLLSHQKLSILNNLQAAFKIEFDIDKTQKKMLDKQYRILFPKMKEFLEGSNQSEYPEIHHIIKEKTDKIKETVLEIKRNIQIPLNDFLSSHIHMMINRQYTSQQRAYELIIYDHLYRFYKTLNYSK